MTTSASPDPVSPDPHRLSTRLVGPGVFNRVKRPLLSVFLGAWIAVAPAAGFVITSAKPFNPFEVAVACTALLYVGFVIGLAFSIFDVAVFALFRIYHRKNHIGWSLAAFLGALAMALSLGACSEIHYPGQ